MAAARDLQRLRKQGLDYLRKELEIWTATPGNSTEVIKILAALKKLEAEDGATREVQPSGKNGDYSWDSVEGSA